MSRLREYLEAQGKRTTNTPRRGNSSLGKNGLILEGFDELMEKILEMPDKMKAGVLRSIIRKNMLPVAESIKSVTPTRFKGSKGNGKPKQKGPIGKGKWRLPAGNLRRSIGVKTFSKGANVSGYAGINVGQGSSGYSDGWYGAFIVRGTKTMPPNNFIRRGAEIAIPKAQADLETEVAAYIKRNAKKLGLDAR